MTASTAISRGRTQLSFTLPEGDSSQNLRTLKKTSKTSKASSRVTSNATLQETWNRLANTHLSQKLPSSLQSPDPSSSSVKFAGSIPGPPLLQSQKKFADLQDDEAGTVNDNEYLDLPDMLELEPLVEISFNDELCKEDLEGIYSKTKTSPFRYMDIMSCAELVDKLNDQNLNRGDDIDPVEVLDKMFPPRFTDFDGRKLLLQVSKMPANSDQRKNLVTKFEALMTERFQSKQYTPDMIHLIEDTLDELLRQEVAENPTRGILLAHVRNCYGFVMHMLETLCDSSHLRAGDSEHDFRQYTQVVNAQLVREETEITNLNHRITELHTAIRKQEVLHERERQELQAKYQTEVDHLRLECNNLKKQIDVAEEFDKALARNKSRNVDVSQSQDVVDETDRKESSPPEHGAMSVKFHGLHSFDVHSDYSHLRISRQQ